MKLSIEVASEARVATFRPDTSDAIGSHGVTPAVVKTGVSCPIPLHRGARWIPSNNMRDFRLVDSWRALDLLNWNRDILHSDFIP